MRAIRSSSILAVAAGTLLGLTAGLSAVEAPPASENVVFPPDAVVDVTKAPYHAKGDGVTDDTAAIQKALSDHPNAGAIIYLPKGTYLLSDTLRWPHGDRGGWEEKRTILQGQGRRHTVLKLRDGCAGFSSPSAGGPIYSADVPGPFVLDPVTGTTRRNTASLTFQSKPGAGKWSCDAVAIPPGTAVRPASFTIEGFLRASGRAERWSYVLACCGEAREYPLAWALDIETWHPGALPKLRMKLQPTGRPLVQARDGGSPTVTGPLWHHFAYTYDAAGGKLKLYWDYKLAHAAAVESPARRRIAYDDAFGLFLGGMPGNPKGLNGQLDEVRLSAAVLKPEAFLRAVRQPAKRAAARKASAATRGYWRLEGEAGKSALGQVVASEVNPKAMNGRGIRGAGRKGKAMLWTGQRPAQRFSNAVRNLTLDTGRNNALAIGAQFMANNQGSFREVTIRSGDGRGLIGLDLSYSDEQGPCLIKNVRVVGFDDGIRCAHGVNSITFEHISLEGQNRCGFRNDGQCVHVRGLKSVNAVPAVRNGGHPSMMVLLDADLRGKGKAADVPAIENAWILHARNVRTAGYRTAIRNTGGHKQGAAGPVVGEFLSHGAVTLFDTPKRPLHLPVKEVPTVPWDPPSQWASPLQFGGVKGKDISESLQKAIDSGKTTVYIPRGGWRVGKTVKIRGKVRRIIGCEPWVDSTAGAQGPVFRVVDGESDVVVFERISGGYAKRTTIEHASKRTLVVSACCNVSCHSTGGGDLFLEDICANPFTNFEFRGGNVWARQLNPENQGTHVLNDGATLWILGLKTERGGTLVETRRGGRTELLGGFCYTTTGPGGAPMFLNDNSAMSVTMGEACFNFKDGPYRVLVREIRDGRTRELKKGDVPGRCNGSAIPLYVGRGQEAEAGR